MWYHNAMIIKTLTKAIKGSKPAIIKERGVPQFVVLDWATYQRWQEEQEEFQDYLEMHDLVVQEHIREGTKEYMAGKSRPAEEFLAELGIMRGRPKYDKPKIQTKTRTG